jgi:hypothetical protein
MSPSPSRLEKGKHAVRHEGFDRLSPFDRLRTRGGFDRLSPNGLGVTAYLFLERRSPVSAMHPRGLS